MSTPPAPTAAARYDRALRYAKHTRHLPPSLKPQPTAAWPPENVALFEHYQEWLRSGGASAHLMAVLYLPMAGHVLGFNLKPYTELNLEADFQPALDYIQAKNVSQEWNHIRRQALDKFRRFLRQQRGEWELRLRPLNYARYTDGLPAWILEPLTRYFHLMRSHWRSARADQQSLRFWSGHARLWRWLLAHYPIAGLPDVKRQQLLDYVDHGLTAGYAAGTINNTLRHFHAFLLYLQEQDYAVPRALLRPVSVKQPNRLPRFLTEEQVRRLRDELEQRVAEAVSGAARRDALLDRATFYLLWHGGLRLGEVEELRLDDLDLPGNKLLVRQGKGQKDRAVYLTATAVQALQAYLPVRGLGGSEHVFLYRNQPLCKDLVRGRLKAAGERLGVKVTPHQLRHTCATQLLNAGCRVTSIQKLLGHRKLNSTLVYARVHDRTVSDDYYAAMARIEQALNVAPDRRETTETLTVTPIARTHLLEIATQLTEPQLGLERRLELVAQMRHMLNGHTPEPAPALAGSC
jgi:integrase/recombinase XerD